MSELPPLPRIVAGHNAAGLGTVKSVDLITPEPAQKFPGAKSRAIWTTTSVPAKDNNDDTDGATRPATGDLGIVAPGATYFGVTELAPGATATWHRTSSVDHNVLISGKLILMMEDGTEQLIDQPGSVVIQKGAMHAWRNPGPEWARWVCVLIDAEPAVVNGKELKGEMRAME